MSDLEKRINDLEPAVAVRVLRDIAKHRVRSQLATELTPDTALATELAAATGTTLALTADEGEVAKAGLLLLADDPDMRPVVEAMTKNSGTESYADPATMLAIGTATLVILQSYIKVERGKDGKWTFKFEKKPLSDTLLGQVISKLGGWIKGS